MSGALFSLCLVSFVLFGGIHYITPHYNSLSENLATALIVKGECGAETISVNNIQTMEYICMSPAHIPVDMFNNPSKTAQVRILNFDLMKLSHFLDFIFFVGSCHRTIASN